MKIISSLEKLEVSRTEEGKTVDIQKSKTSCKYSIEDNIVNIGITFYFKSFMLRVVVCRRERSLFSQVVA